MLLLDLRSYDFNQPLVSSGSFQSSAARLRLKELYGGWQAGVQGGLYLRAGRVPRGITPAVHRTPLSRAVLWKPSETISRRACVSYIIDKRPYRGSRRYLTTAAPTRLRYRDLCMRNAVLLAPTPSRSIIIVWHRTRNMDLLCFLLILSHIKYSCGPSGAAYNSNLVLIIIIL